jgi:hypothetical protein
MPEDSAASGEQLERRPRHRQDQVSRLDRASVSTVKRELHLDQIRSAFLTNVETLQTMPESNAPICFDGAIDFLE